MVLVKLTRSGKASVVTLTPDSNWTALCCSFPHSQEALTSHAPPWLGQAARGTPSLGAGLEALRSLPQASSIPVQEGEILCTL